MEEIQGDDCFRILDLEQYVIFYFTASWCAPCQRIAPEIVNLSNELDETKIKFFKIDIDQEDNNEICEKCEIKSVPSFLLFKNRNYLNRVQVANLEKIKEMIINNIKIKELKWSNDGELSSIDMARILDRLKNQQLTTCDIEEASNP